MIARRLALAVCAATLGVALLGPAVAAQEPAPIRTPTSPGELFQDCSLDSLLECETVQDDLEDRWDEFVDGWQAFSSWQFFAQELASLLIAIGLSALIAFHPRSWSPASRAADPDQPKAILIYALVGAAVSELVLYNPPMSLVIFGIGGLLRFRSVIGTAKDTARTILAVTIGLASGLKLFPLAVLVTIFAWCLIWILEAHVRLRIQVRELEKQDVPNAAEAWTRALEERGCRLRSVRIRPSRGRLDLEVYVPSVLDPERMCSDPPVEAKFAGRTRWRPA